MPGNARRGRPQGQCHRKQTAPPADHRSATGVRVKGCGKSAPRARRRERHGKPHREQDRIGAADPMLFGAEGQACFRAAARVGRARRPATGVPDEWSSPTLPMGGSGQNPAYKPSGLFSTGCFHANLTADPFRVSLSFGNFPKRTHHEQTPAALWREFSSAVDNYSVNLCLPEYNSVSNLLIVCFLQRITG